MRYADGSQRGTSKTFLVSLSGIVLDAVHLGDAQGSVRATKSNESGFFSFPDLTPSTIVI
jgi:hypothetical protein